MGLLEKVSINEALENTKLVLLGILFIILLPVRLVVLVFLVVFTGLKFLGQELKSVVRDPKKSFEAIILEDLK
jgi:hypothetical protein